MPTYTYLREDGEYFEVNQSIKDYDENGPLEECPKTGQPCERVIGGGDVLFKFKGSGFHSTDYDSQGPKDDDVLKNKDDPDRDTFNYK